MVQKNGDTTGSVVVSTLYQIVHLVSVILTEINRVAVVQAMESVATLKNIVPVKTVQTTNYSKTGMNQMEHLNGGMTGGVVFTTTSLIMVLVSAILTEINHVVVVVAVESVVTLQNIVLVKTVQTTDVYTESGENQMVHRSGDTTGGVVVTTAYLTVQMFSVILTEINRVVVIGGKESVVTQQHIVLVRTVQTTHVYTESGGNQEVQKNGDTTGIVVVTTLYQTVHLVSVILTVINSVVIGMENVATLKNIVPVKTVQTTNYSKTGMNQMEHLNGGMTGGVVFTTTSLIMVLVSAILTEINHVVVVVAVESVVTLQNIVLVRTVQTTRGLKIGGNQEVH